jgi:hypothetical protein
MTHWNYRVIRFGINSSYSEDEAHFAIHEVHYNDDGTPRAYAEFAARMIWNDGENGLDVLDMMREAFAKPVLTEEDFK